mmetsp:Transcript_2254/g.5255  ORF Transcript_2254/g.5255 Transcript_2254/m.5255 type:complete len:205 (-) Transcript_2254:204-818(-)
MARAAEEDLEIVSLLPPQLNSHIVSCARRLLDVGLRVPRRPPRPARLGARVAPPCRAVSQRQTRRSFLQTLHLAVDKLLHSRPSSSSPLLELSRLMQKLLDPVQLVLDLSVEVSRPVAQVGAIVVPKELRDLLDLILDLGLDRLLLLLLDSLLLVVKPATCHGGHEARDRRDCLGDEVPCPVAADLARHCRCFVSSRPLSPAQL